MRSAIILVAAAAGVVMVLAGCRGRAIIGTSVHEGICRMHNVPMRLGTVPIVYGLIMRNDAAATLFPNAMTYRSGGCVVSEDSPKEAEVWYCPECRRAEERYRLSSEIEN